MSEDLKKTSAVSDDELEDVSGGNSFFMTLETNSLRDRAIFDTLEEKEINGRRKSGARLTTLENNSRSGKGRISKL